MVRTYSTCVRTYVRTYVWYVHVYGETSERCQHRRHHGILRFQLDSDVCSADLHHNQYILTMLCHNFLIGKGHTCALRTTCVLGTYTSTYRYGIPIRPVRTRVPSRRRSTPAPFIVVTGGYMDHLFLATEVPPRRRLADPGALQETVTPRRRVQGECALQAYTFADIVVAIPAVDLAVEAVVWR